MKQDKAESTDGGGPHNAESQKADSPSVGSIRAPHQGQALRRYEWVILAAILLAAAGLRASYLREIMHEPDFAHPALDPQFHDYWARAMVSGDWTPPEGMPDPMIRSTPYGRAPGYPYFLALVYWLSGSSYLVARVVQMALGLMNCVLMWVLGRALFGRAVGLIAAGFMAVYWVFVYFEGELNGLVIEVLLVLAFMNLLGLWIGKPGLLRAALAGLVLGLFILFRPNALLFCPVLVAWMGWMMWRQGQLRRFLATACVAAAGVVLAIAPVTARNYFVSGEFFPVTYAAGVNLYIGNNETSDCVLPTIPEVKELAGIRTWTFFHYPAIVQGIAQRLEKESITYAEASRYFKDKAWGFIKENPGKALGYVGKRALLFWGPVEITSNKVTHYAKRHSPTLRHIPGFPLVLAMFLAGLLLLLADIRSWRGQSPEKARRRVWLSTVILLFIAVYFCTFLPFLVSCRFRVPLIPLLFLFGAYGVYRIGRFAAARELAKAAIWCGVGAGLFALCSVQFVPYEPELDYWHLQRAIAFEKGGQLDRAIEEFKKAVETNGEFAGSIPFNRLGVIFKEQANTDEAARYYTMGLEKYPLDPIMNTNMAALLAEQGKPDEAMDHYQIALRVDPANSRIHNNVGLLLASQGKADEAVAHYREAVRLEPQFAVGYSNMAVVLAGQRKFEEAEEQFARALQMSRRGKSTPEDLGAVLEMVGETDSAIAYYRAALEKSPGDTRTRTKLAKLLADRGELHEASRHYAEAFKEDKAKRAQALVEIGNRLVSEGRIDEATEHFEQAVVLDRENADAIFNLGVLAAGKGELDDALVYYGKVLELNPDDAVVANNMGLVLARQGEFQEAIAYFNLALGADPSLVRTYNNLGNVLAAQDEFDRAIEQYEAALEIDPGDRLAHYNLGRVLALQGKTDQALSHYEHALETYPDKARVHVNMGLLLAQKGELENAIEHFKAALEIDPDHKAAQENLEKAIAAQVGK